MLTPPTLMSIRVIYWCKSPHRCQIHQHCSYGGNAVADAAAAVALQISCSRSAIPEVLAEHANPLTYTVQMFSSRTHDSQLRLPTTRAHASSV